MEKHNIKSNKGWDNLKDNSAPDKPGETVAITVRITPEQKEWLKNQTKGMGFHVRQALQAYIDACK